ncbi:unnamed protein product [Trichobilharzia szidati]|nr:unnamed protein product [Trichobilharzia szidati]
MEHFSSVPFRFDQYIRLSHAQIKACRQASYNAFAFGVLSLIFGAALSVYYTLQIFFMPLIWAFLCGTVLYPFKSSLTDIIRGWIRRVDAEDQLLLVETIVVPFRILNALSSILLHKASDYSSLLKSSLFLLLTFHVCSFFDFFWLPGLFSNAAYLCISLTDYVLGLTSFKLVAALGVAHAITALIQPCSFYFVHTISHLFWVILLLWCTSFAGVLRLPVFLASVAVLVIGYWCFGDTSDGTYQERWASCHTVTAVDGGSGDHVRNAVSCDTLATANMERSQFSESSEQIFHSQAEYGERRDQRGRPQRWSQFLRQALLSIPTGSDYGFDPVSELRAFMSEQFRLTSAKSTSAVFERQRFFETTDTIHHPECIFDATDRNSSVPSAGSFVNRCFLALCWAHFLVIIWMYQWPLHLVCFVLICVGIFRLSQYLQIQEFSRWLFCKLSGIVQAFVPNLSMEQRRSYLKSLIPKPVHGLFTLLAYCDRKLCHYLDSWLDSVVSLFILVFFIFAFCLLTMFLAFQIHNESIRLVSLTSDLINKAMNSEAYSWLPKKEQVDGMFGVLAANAYQAGRSWISDRTNELFEGDPNSKAILKEQLLDLWENVYNSFINQPINNTVAIDESRSHKPSLPFLPNNTHNHVNSSRLVSNTFGVVSSNRFSINTTWIFNRHALSSLFVIIKQNLGTLATVTESLWIFVRSNLNLIAHFITVVLSSIMSGGHVAVNFIIAFLIFLTVLYYVLAASGSCYLPVAFITSLAPSTPKMNALITHFSSAVEVAISGVFVATLKLAVFYGLYTSLTHTIFGLDLVVVPSVLAALLGAVPIIGTYWAVLPGVIEILIIRQSLTQAGLLILFHVLPTYVVDVAVYREIKGAGHPYFTGLAIAGGIYYQGPAGALFGPILLCCFLVGMNMFRWILDSSKTEYPVNQCVHKPHYSPTASLSPDCSYRTSNSFYTATPYQTINSTNKRSALSSKYRRPIFKRRSKYQFTKNSFSMPDISDISDESGQNAQSSQNTTKPVSPSIDIQYAHTSTPAPRCVPFHH